VTEQDKSGSLYDALWQQALAALARCEVVTDPHLLARNEDRRTGLTVIARPGGQVVERVTAFLARLRQVAPCQYYYAPDELHLTVLSLFTATEDAAPYLAAAPRYRKILADVLAQARPFRVRFRGVTASPSAVMVQGFALDERLEELRRRLREALGEQGLGEWLDQRYHIATAHLTVARFQSQPHDVRALADLLTSYREWEFGETTFDVLQWVKNDWYMSSGKVEVLERYRLKREGDERSGGVPADQRGGAQGVN
jgi:2'-5' RNA ligase